MKKFLVLFLFAFYACKSKYEISESDKKFLPYSGNEQLIFKYGLRSDTVTLDGFKEAYVENSFNNGKSYLSERYILKCKTDSIANGLEPLNYFAFLSAESGGKRLILMSFKYEESFLGSIKLDYLNEHSKQVFKLDSDRIIKDVVIIPNKNPLSKSDTSRSGIEYIAWSLKHGMIGYRLYTGELYKLR